MPPVPVPKANELIARLMSVAETANAGSVNELALRRIENEATALLKVDVLQGHVVLGIVNAIKGDEQKSREHHELAIQLRDIDVTRRNYANSLVHLRLFDDAWEQFDIVLKQCPDDITLLKKLFEWTVRAGYPHRAQAYSQQLLKLEPLAKDDEELAKYTRVNQLLLQAGLDDADMSAIDALAVGVANDFGAEIVGHNTWEDNFERSEPCIVRVFNVRGADVDEMSWALAERKAEANTPALRSGRYHVGFSPAPEA